MFYKKQTGFIFLTLIVLQSCLMRYGLHTITDYTPLSSEKYENTTGTVDVYLQGVSVPRPFKQIGMVEITGERDVKNEKLLAYLKNTALENGADAVIEVKLNYKRREEGLVIDPEHADVYAAKVLSGVTVKYTNWPSSDSSAIASADTAFKRIVREDTKAKQSRYVMDLIFTTMAGMIILWGVSAQGR